MNSAREMAARPLLVFPHVDEVETLTGVEAPLHVGDRAFPDARAHALDEAVEPRGMLHARGLARAVVRRLRRERTSDRGQESRPRIAPAARERLGGEMIAARFELDLALGEDDRDVL